MIKSEPSKCEECLQFHWGSCPVMEKEPWGVPLPDPEAYAALEHENSHE